jgi:ferredoxin
MVEVDKSICIGCGACASACPDCFELGDDGKSHVLTACKDDSCKLGDVAENCPVGAITVK